MALNKRMTARIRYKRLPPDKDKPKMLASLDGVGKIAIEFTADE